MTAKIICLCVGKLQQKMRTSTAEALSRLDMVGAVRDHRRFNYVCKVTWQIAHYSLCSVIQQGPELNLEHSKQRSSRRNDYSGEY